MVRHEASKTVETVLIVYYIHTQLYIQAGGVDRRTVHFLRVEECTEGVYSPYCSGYSRGIGSLHTLWFIIVLNTAKKIWNAVGSEPLGMFSSTCKGNNFNIFSSL
jgi:hypothetical protein